jgi:hypothetical protein
MKESRNMEKIKKKEIKRENHEWKGLTNKINFLKKLVAVLCGASS